MDIRYFLGERLAFIQQLYANGASPFVETKRKIEAGEHPFEHPYSEDSEPPFLSDWQQAEESLQVIGHTCISMLSASLHLYLKAWEKKLGRVSSGKYKSEFKKGWFNGYRAYFFGEFGVRFEDSPCNLTLLEELVLARNRIQHPEFITSQRTAYSTDDLRKLSRPFFISGGEEDLLSEMEEDERRWLMPPTIDVNGEKLAAASREISRFAEWLEETDH